MIAAIDLCRKRNETVLLQTEGQRSDYMDNGHDTDNEHLQRWSVSYHVTRTMDNWMMTMDYYVTELPGMVVDDSGTSCWIMTV